MELRRRSIRMWICAAALFFSAHAAMAGGSQASQSATPHSRQKSSRARLRTVAARTAAANASAKAADAPPSTPGPLCRVSDLTVELPKEFFSLRVANNSFLSSDNSVAMLTLQNNFSQPIDELGLVVEYLDAKNQILFSTVFAASINDGAEPSWFAQNLPSQYSIIDWKNPIGPGKTFTIGSTSGITVAECPAQAKVTLVHLVFDDGSAKDWGAPGWQVPVQPQEIPGALRISASEKTLPQRFLIRVHVPAPIGPIIPPPVIDLIGGRRTYVFDQIKEQMQDWRFWFKLRNGAAVDGDEVLLVRVHSLREVRRGDVFRIKRDEVRQPLGIIDVVPRKGSHEWGVFYGGVNLATGPAVLSQR